ncbi:hypothetical protein J1N35_011276, partial [Gossypium stocksii]
PRRVVQLILTHRHVLLVTLHIDNPHPATCRTYNQKVHLKSDPNVKSSSFAVFIQYLLILTSSRTPPKLSSLYLTLFND